MLSEAPSLPSSLLRGMGMRAGGQITQETLLILSRQDEVRVEPEKAGLGAQYERLSEGPSRRLSRMIGKGGAYAGPWSKDLEVAFIFPTRLFQHGRGTSRRLHSAFLASRSQQGPGGWDGAGWGWVGLPFIGNQLSPKCCAGILHIL